MSQTQHKGPVAWVTGGDTSIGRHLALMLAEEGWAVAVSGRAERRLARIAELAEGGGRITPYPVDFRDALQIADTVARIEHDLGGIQLAVLNASEDRPMNAENFDPKLLRYMLQANFTAVGYCLDALLPHLRRRAEGQILVDVGVAAQRGLPDNAAYGPSRAALLNLAESLHGDLAREGISLRVINRGLGRAGTGAGRGAGAEVPRQLVELDKMAVAAAIVRGLERKGFELNASRRPVLLMRLLRLLPYRAYFAAVQRLWGRVDVEAVSGSQQRRVL